MNTILSVARLNQPKIEQAWQNLAKELSNSFGKTLDFQGLLFLIGLQELGQFHRKFKKEEKQDLMHIGVCELLSLDGYFEFVGRDEDGWLHYRPAKGVPLDLKDLGNQELLLKRQMLKYFEKWEEEG